MCCSPYFHKYKSHIRNARNSLEMDISKTRAILRARPLMPLSNGNTAGRIRLFQTGSGFGVGLDLDQTERSCLGKCDPNPVLFRTGFGSEDDQRGKRHFFSLFEVLESKIYKRS